MILRRRETTQANTWLKKLKALRQELDRIEDECMRREGDDYEESDLISSKAFKTWSQKYSRDYESFRTWYEGKVFPIVNELQDITRGEDEDSELSEAQAALQDVDIHVGIAWDPDTDDFEEGAPDIVQYVDDFGVDGALDAIDQMTKGVSTLTRPPDLSKSDWDLLEAYARALENRARQIRDLRRKG